MVWPPPLQPSPETFWTCYMRQKMCLTNPYHVLKLCFEYLYYTKDYRKKTFEKTRKIAFFWQLWPPGDLCNPPPDDSRSVVPESNIQDCSKMKYWNNKPCCFWVHFYHLNTFLTSLETLKPLRRRYGHFFCKQYDSKCFKNGVFWMILWISVM